MKNKFNPIKTFAALAVVSLLVTGCASTPQYTPGRESGFSDYLLAVYASTQGDRELASRSYLKVLKQNPGNEKLLNEASSYFLFNGEYANALKIAGDFYSLNPDDTTNSMLLALQAFKKGDLSAMEEYLTHVKGFGLDTLMAPIMRAWGEAAAGNADAALDALKPLLATKPFEPFYDENRALILDYSGLDAEAEAAYARLIARDDIASLQPALNYSALLQSQGRGDEALAVLQRFQAMVPGNTQLEDAVRRLQAGRRFSVIARDTNAALAAAFLYTGVELGRDRAFLPAIVYTRFALYLDPGLDEGHLYLGNLLAGEENPALALEAYSRVNPAGPFGEIALLRQALVLSEHDQWDEAIRLARDHLAENPESFDALVTLGDLHRNREDYSEALDYYEAAIALRGDILPEDWFLLFTRAIAYERLGRWAEAEADFLKVLEFRPNEPDVLNYLGYSWIDLGINLEEGRKMIERAVEQRPDSGFIVDSLGWAEYLTGDYEAAVESLERAVFLEPGDPTLNDHLGDAYWKVGREREARFQWNHALGLNPAPEERAKIEAKIEYGYTLAEALQERK